VDYLKLKQNAEKSTASDEELENLSAEQEGEVNVNV